MKHVLFFSLLIAQPLFAIDFQDPRAVAAAAVSAHPTPARIAAEAAAARERVMPAGSLPNPMLMAGVQNKQVDLRDDEMMTMYMVGVSQTLVRPEKREARRESAQLAADALEKELDSVRAEIERDALLAWYELAAADAQLHATEHVRELTDAVVAAARVRYEVGTSLQADVIRAQLQGSDLDLEIIRLRGSRRAALARLLPLLGLPMTTDVPRVQMPENSEALAIDGPAVAPADHPAIVALQTEIERMSRELRLAELELRPDIDLEAQYGHRAMQRDMFSVTARIELPLRAKQISEPRAREATLRRTALEQRIEELRRSLSQAMAEAVVAHEQATHQLRFLREVLVPQAQLAFESTLAAYQSGKAPFDAILGAESAYLRLRLQYFEFLARHAQAVVNYEALRRGARSSAMSASSAPGAKTAAPVMSSMGSM
ncbi:MAG TPA: TolC family protein [Thermoanaerobaculia bacterium]|nr:TolC family protein [Thermoanaerobaculia bacterium]